MAEYYKKIFSLVLCFVLLLACNTMVFADGTKKNVHIFYRVNNNILACQNRDEDIVRGKKEFEETIRKYYEKRFNLKKIEQTPYEKLSIDYFKNRCSLGEYGFFITIELEGQSTQTEYYQNGYGAETAVTSPTTLVHLIEFIIIPGNDIVYRYDYGTKSYGKGTIAIGRDVFVADSDPRRNAKGAIEGCLRDACKVDKTINKYANEGAYKIESWRYAGDFNIIYQIKNEQIEQTRNNNIKENSLRKR